MNIIRWNHKPTVANPLEKFFNEDFDNFFARPNRNLPATNIQETDNEFVLDIAAPGMDKKDFKVNLDENVLSISTEKKDEKKEENDNYTRREFAYDSFCRSFTLPDTVDIDKIKADYKDGILRINLPKREEAKVTKNREIKIS